MSLSSAIMPYMQSPIKHVIHVVSKLEVYVILPGLRRCCAVAASDGGDNLVIYENSAQLERLVNVGHASHVTSLAAAAVACRNYVSVEQQDRKLLVTGIVSGWISSLSECPRDRSQPGLKRLLIRHKKWRLRGVCVA